MTRSTAQPAACTVHGGAPLTGSVRVGGFKHALVPLAAASVLASGPVELTNVPRVEDSRVLATILAALGAEVRYDVARARMRLDTRGMTGTAIPTELAALVHGPIYLLPVLLARFGSVRLGPTGGCRIGPAAAGGARPIEHLLDVLTRFGARVESDGRVLRGRCAGLRAAHIDLRDYAEPGAGGPTGPLYSGATKCAVLAAAGAHGTTVLEHPYPKPDVTSLVAALAAAGVPIERDDRRLAIHGSGTLEPFAAALVGDLIEVVTFVAAALHTRSTLTITGAGRETLAGLGPELDLLAAMGVGLVAGADGLVVTPAQRLRGVDVEIASHGAFSDSHPFLSLVLLGADRPSRITETVWRDRFGYVEPLRRLGADIRAADGAVTIRPSALAPADGPLRADDLRSAAVLVLAALAIPAATTVEGVDHLARGYDDLLGKLRLLGARIE